MMTQVIVDHGAAGTIGGALEELKMRVRRYRVYRNTLGELSHLTDRELADLGLSRAEIRRIAYKAAYG